MSRSYAKYANIYDLDGTLINHVGKDGKLHDLTIEEIEKIVDRLGEDKDENGNIRRKTEFNNASMILWQAYQKYGNPHEKEIIEKIKAAQERKTTVEDKTKALQEIASELDTKSPKTTESLPISNGQDDGGHDDNRGEYAEFEEIQ